MQRAARNGAIKAIWIALAAIIALLSPAQAQDAITGPEPGRTYRIGIITYAGLGMAVPIKRSLAEIGYQEGVNVEYRESTGNRQIELMDGLAEELVAWQPDLIISLMTNAHVAMKKATQYDPIPVVLWSADPLETGVIESFRKPGTNFTGFTYEPYTQVLEVRFLKLAVPGIKCIGHLYNSTYAPAPSTMRELRAAGELMGVAINVHEVLEQEKLPEAIAQMAAEGCGGFVVGPHELFNRNGQLIGQLAQQHGLAAVSIQTSVTDGGGVAAFSPPFERGWAAMVPVIDKLLHGANPAEIPVERGFKSPLTINLKATRQLGLELPASLIDEAEIVIE